MTELEKFIRRLDKKAISSNPADWPVEVSDLYELVRAIQADYPAPKESV